MPVSKPTYLPRFASLAAWQAVHYYTVGERINNGGNLYVVATPGTSAAMGGPAGAGAGIVDGTDGLTWDYVSAAGTAALLTTPTAADADTGALVGYRFPAQYFNKLFGGIYLWILYLGDLANQAWTWTGLHSFYRQVFFAGKDADGSPSDPTPCIVFDVTGGVAYKLLYRTYDSAHPLNPEICVYECMDTLIGPVGSLVTAVNAVYTSGVGWACQDVTNAATITVQGYGVIASYSHAAQMAPWADGAWIPLQSTAVTTGNFFVKGTLDAASLTATNNVTSSNGMLVGQHVVSNSGAPTGTIGANAGAGGGSSITVAGSDACGVVSLVAGTTPTSGIIARVTFSKKYSPIPSNVIVVAQSANSLGLSATAQGVVGVIDLAGGYFEIKNAAGGALAATTGYVWGYILIG